MNAFELVLGASLLVLGSQLVSAVGAAEGSGKDLLSLKEDIQNRVRLSGQASAAPSQDPAAPGLVFTARKEQFPIPGGREMAEYTSASLVTRGKASWTYGRMELRAKLPKGRGAWPAFWTGGVAGSWPAAGEIDIMEYWASHPHTVTSNIHFALGGRHTGTGGGVDVENPWDDFHVYAVEWKSERMDFFCDGVKYFTFHLSKADENGANPFRKPHSLLLNLALVGGKGAVDDSSLPQKFVIDYVRVYQPAEPDK